MVSLGPWRGARSTPPPHPPPGWRPLCCLEWLPGPRQATTHCGRRVPASQPCSWTHQAQLVRKNVEPARLGLSSGCGGSGRLAGRWDEQLCTLVVGLRPARGRTQVCQPGWCLVFPELLPQGSQALPGFSLPDGWGSSQINRVPRTQAQLRGTWATWDGALAGLWGPLVSAEILPQAFQDQRPQPRSPRLWTRCGWGRGRAGEAGPGYVHSAVVSRWGWL